MATKKDIVQNLKNIKLVIGNGFDLSCTLKTKYSHFFEAYKKQNRVIFDEITEYKNAIEQRKNLNKVHPNTFNPPYLFLSSFTAKLDNINVWYILFYLASEGENVNEFNWCDIESIIYISLTKRIKNQDEYNEIPSFPEICDLLIKVKKEKIKIEIKNITKNRILAVFINQITKCHIESENDFYAWLLKQLVEFEKEFGNYISKIHECNTNFKDKADSLIKNITNPENIKSIYTFNYDDLGDEKYNVRLKHINGDVNSPIFGIDSQKINPNEPAYLFTKINRRILQDINVKEINEEAQFDNLIIYGHSLNEADFSYFFVEFEKLNLVDTNCKSKVVFAYSIYDENKREEIKLNLTNKVGNLFYKYSLQKNPSIDGNLLLEKLYAQQKVILYEV